MSNNRKRRPTHPGVILREDVLPELGLSQAQFANLLGLSRSYVNKIIKERCPITEGLAHRLARVLGTTPELWVNLQKALDHWEVNEEGMADHLTLPEQKVRFASVPRKDSLLKNTDERSRRLLIFTGTITPLRLGKETLKKSSHLPYWEVLESEFRAANLL